MVCVLRRPEARFFFFLEALLHLVGLCPIACSSLTLEVEKKQTECLVKVKFLVRLIRLQFRYKCFFISSKQTVMEERQ